MKAIPFALVLALCIPLMSLPVLQGEDGVFVLNPSRPIKFFTVEDRATDLPMPQDSRYFWTKESRDYATVPNLDGNRVRIPQGVWGVKLVEDGMSEDMIVERLKAIAPLKPMAVSVSWSKSEIDGDSPFPFGRFAEYLDCDAVRSLVIASNLFRPEMLKLVALFPKLETLELSLSKAQWQGWPSLPDEFVFPPSLKHAALFGDWVNSSVIEKVCNVKELVELSFEASNVDASAAQFLKRAANLEYFNVRFGSVFRNARIFEDMKRLKGLDFSDQSVRAEQTAESIKGMHLRILGVRCPTAEEIREIAKHSEISVLRLHGGREVHPEWIDELVNLKQIRKLCLPDVWFDDSMADAVSMLADLESLEIHDATKLTAVGARKLQSLSALKELRLTGQDFPATLLESLASLPCLRRVQSQAQFEPEAMRMLPKFSVLRDLAFRADYLDDAGIAPLADCKSLTRLDISHSAAITSEGVKRLCKIAGLEELSLSYCFNVDSSWLPDLRGLKSLWKLHLLFPEMKVSDFKTADGLPPLRFLSIDELSEGSIFSRADYVQMYWRVRRDMLAQWCSSVEKNKPGEFPASGFVPQALHNINNGCRFAYFSNSKPDENTGDKYVIEMAPIGGKLSLRILFATEEGRYYYDAADATALKELSQFRQEDIDFDAPGDLRIKGLKLQKMEAEGR